MRVLRFEKEEDLFTKAAADVLVSRPRTLGLAAGKTPEKLYQEICRQHRGELLNTHFFHLDEFVGLNSENQESFGHQMRSLLLNPLRIPEAQIHLLNGKARDLSSEARNYERQIETHGKIDLQILGLGLNGHLAFNEPGSSKDSRTRQVRLTAISREANQHLFGTKPVPEDALTLGLGTILEARALWLFVPQKAKFEILQRAMNGPVTTDVPASVLQQHPQVTIWRL